eukprot:CAMPEP_0117441064 /NCGR_PEP_ID=MMETSP0759-20121206/3430_1 /TAXON_ID=63605 /ORGANISM="Percolomonas cosmopolitus, Strain WS" /LENGTH=401 /DNA_ID=CAMNT_0005232883 /DNA_START=9 /DNA_END=1211 /DNA_ORIENTATION=-
MGENILMTLLRVCRNVSTLETLVCETDINLRHCDDTGETCLFKVRYVCCGKYLLENYRNQLPPLLQKSRMGETCIDAMKRLGRPTVERLFENALLTESPAAHTSYKRASSCTQVVTPKEPAVQQGKKTRSEPQLANTKELSFKGSHKKAEPKKTQRKSGVKSGIVTQKRPFPDSSRASKTRESSSDEEHTTTRNDASDNGSKRSKSARSVASLFRLPLSTSLPLQQASIGATTKAQSTNIAQCTTSVATNKIAKMDRSTTSHALNSIMDFQNDLNTIKEATERALVYTEQKMDEILQRFSRVTMNSENIAKRLQLKNADALISKDIAQNREEREALKTLCAEVDVCLKCDWARVIGNMVVHAGEALSCVREDCEKHESMYSTYLQGMQAHNCILESAQRRS